MKEFTGHPNVSKDEAIRLRIEERRPVSEIVKILGKPKSTVYQWLKDYPLSETELLTRKIDAAKKQVRGPRKLKGNPSKFYAAVEFSDLGRNRKAKVAEAAVLFRLVLHGFDVYGRVFDGQKADWVVEGQKVQVRFARWCKYGTPIVSLRCGGGSRNHRGKRRFEDGEFDVLVGYDLYTDTAFVWRWDELTHLQTAVSASEEAAEAWHKLRPISLVKDANTTCGSQERKGNAAIQGEAETVRDAVCARDGKGARQRSGYAGEPEAPVCCTNKVEP